MINRFRKLTFVGLLYITILCSCQTSAATATSQAEIVTEFPTTPTSVAPATPRATETATATSTPEGINLEKFHKVPSSYEYLLAHPDEFVQAPDPNTDRAAFDKWFMEEFVPALGPVSERPLNLRVYTSGPTIFGYQILTRPAKPVSGELSFFHFVSGGVEYPVPCINVDRGYTDEGTYSTYCVALFDSRNGLGLTPTALDGLVAGEKVLQVDIYTNLAGLPGVDLGSVGTNMINTLGEYNDHNNMIRFGMGFLLTQP
jgi:hypothetical protein